MNTTKTGTYINLTKSYKYIKIVYPKLHYYIIIIILNHL